LPFHHPQSDGLWRCFARDGQVSTEYRLTTCAAVDPSFAAFESDPHNRLNAKRVLIRDYFQPEEQAGLRELTNMSADEADPANLDGSPLVIEEAVKQGREARFRLRVVAVYNYTCALTGYRLTTITGGSVVDAAHIHRFADSRNNDLRNGLALSKTAHWLFDQGLWSITDDFKVVVACAGFTESGPDSMRLAQYHDRPLLHLPADSAVRPDPVHLAWHRRHVFEEE
jgi:putative restriction endonuclease